MKHIRRLSGTHRIIGGRQTYRVDEGYCSIIFCTCKGLFEGRGTTAKKAFDASLKATREHTTEARARA